MPQVILAKSYLKCRDTSSPWPGSRGVLLLRLFMRLFPLSDRRHPVTTPLARLLGLHLAVCPVTRPHDVAIALLLASLLQQIARSGGRYAPEATPLCETLLHSCVSKKHRIAEYAPPAPLPEVLNGLPFLCHA
jgi:Nop14-like family